ncbi:hypothetical protein BXU09_20140 [Deinococcus sp. LM3]|nr:hypothetical protein BXU09_20140 [Deinococcus sp. LM3]
MPSLALFTFQLLTSMIPRYTVLPVPAPAGRYSNAMGVRSRRGLHDHERLVVLDPLHFAQVDAAGAADGDFDLVAPVQKFWKLMVRFSKPTVTSLARQSSLYAAAAGMAPFTPRGATRKMLSRPRVIFSFSSAAV